MVKVPLSLKILFRKISIQVPNIEKLVCGLMRTAGLKLPQSMAKNLLQSCNLVFKLLKVFPGCKLHLYKLLIGQVTQKLNVMPDVPENQVFYSVLSQYFKHCLTTEDFLIAKHIFNTTFKIEKNVEDKMAMSFERDDDKGTEANLSISQEETVHHLIDLLSVVNSVVIYGPPKSGKSFVIKEVCKFLLTIGAK